MKLIVEDSHKIEFISEENEGKKDYYIQGIFMQSETKNKNGRVYPSAILEKEVDRYINDVIKNGRSLGELNHPEGPTINLDRASHRIVSLRKEGNNIHGKAKVLNTPCGNIVKNLIDEGITLGVSSRGLGSIAMKNGIQEVQSDYHLCTVDIVADPSAHDAFVEGILENKEWVYENGLFKESKIIHAKKEIKKATSKELESLKVKIFESFFNDLKNKI